MALDPVTLLALSTACAPQVSPQTMLAIVQVESGRNPLAIGLNGGGRAAQHTDRAMAIAEATRWIAAGRSVDLGLAQINSRNLRPLGLTIADAFEPCRNLAAGAAVLRSGYRRAAPQQRGSQAALRIALSYYNTGDPDRGRRNGYVAKVVTAASGRPAAGPVRPPAMTIAVEPAPAWDVFRRPHASGAAALIFTPGRGGAS